MMGTETPRASSRSTIRGTAAAASSWLTVTRTSSLPAAANWATWDAVASTSAVSVLVMDCTTIGWAEPTGMGPTQVVTVCLRVTVLMCRLIYRVAWRTMERHHSLSPVLYWCYAHHHRPHRAAADPSWAPQGRGEGRQAVRHRPHHGARTAPGEPRRRGGAPRRRGSAGRASPGAHSPEERGWHAWCVGRLHLALPGHAAALWRAHARGVRRREPHRRGFAPRGARRGRGRLRDPGLGRPGEGPTGGSGRGASLQTLRRLRAPRQSRSTGSVPREPAVPGR